MLEDYDKDLCLPGIDEFAASVMGVIRSGPPRRAREIAEVISPVHYRQLVRKVNCALYGQLAPFVAKDEKHRWSPRFVEDASGCPANTKALASSTSIPFGQPRGEQVSVEGLEGEQRQGRRFSCFVVAPSDGDLKSCPQCALFKPLNEFGERRVAPDKVIVQSWCRECRRTAKRRSARGEDIEAGVPAGGGKAAEIGEEPQEEMAPVPAGEVGDTFGPGHTLSHPTVANGDGDGNNQNYLVAREGPSTPTTTLERSSVGIQITVPDAVQGVGAEEMGLTGEIDVAPVRSEGLIEKVEWAGDAIVEHSPCEKDAAALSRAGVNWAIFEDRRPRGSSRKALELAATAVQAARQERGLDTDAPWSLGELGAKRDDLCWLRAWARSLDAMDVEDLLKGSPEERATLGLLLVWLAVEEARRAKGVFQWRLVGKRFNDNSAWRLLCSNGELLTTAALELVKVAATHYHLRRPNKSLTNVNVHELLELQYGFTTHAFGLDWLKGARPPGAVEVLLSPQTGSASFQAWWTALQGALKGDLPPEVAQERVDSNPWASAFPPGALYARLAAERDNAAERKPTRTTTRKASANGVASAQAEHGLEASNATISSAKDENINGPAVGGEGAPEVHGFLTPARLLWPLGGQPTFTTLLANLDTLELTHERYIVTVAGAPKAELVRRANGSYRASPSDVLEVSLVAPQVAIQIIEPDGGVVAGCELALWVPDDDIAMYELHQGRRLDPWSDVVSCNRDYAMLLAPDFTVVSGPEGVIPSGADLPRVLHLKAGWSPQLRVTLEGEECWTPLLGSGRNVPPAWANKIELGAPKPPSTIQFGDNIESVVHLRDDLLLSYARMAGRMLAVIPLGNNRYRLGPIEAHPEALSRGLLRVVLGLRRGNEFYRKELSLGTIVLGGYLDTTQGPRTLRRGTVLDVDGAVALRFALPPKHNTTTYAGKRYSRWVLMEGERVVDRLTVNGRALVKTLAGLGAPLTLRRDPFSNGTVKIDLAREVRQTGIVAGLADSPDGWLHVRLRHPLEPDTRHRFVLWMADGGQRNIAPTATEPDIWSIAGLAGLPGVVALAVTFGEERLGGAWPAAWHEALPAAFTRSASEAAGRLRWFGCPILGETARATVRSVLLTHLSACLALWLPPQGAPPTGLEAVWWSAVAELLGDTRLDELPLLTLLGDQQNETLVDVASPLLHLDPVLGARLVYAWTEMVGRTNTNMEVLERLRNSFGEQTDPTTSLRVCERSLRLSRGLIIELVQRWQNVLAEDLRPPQRRLLRAGIQLVPEFRAYLGWHLLNHISQELARKPLCRR